jgi:hypothetical protein
MVGEIQRHDELKLRSARPDDVPQGWRSVMLEAFVLIIIEDMIFHDQEVFFWRHLHLNT